MNEVQHFVKPYPQEALGGELGLTSIDIAKAIGLKHHHFVRDLQQRGYMKFLAEAGFRFIQFGIIRTGPGRRGKAFAFDMDASKAVFAQSRTADGARSLRHLIECERIVQTAVPKLVASLPPAPRRQELDS